MTARMASCACGQLRVTCTGEPQMVSLCHCLDCQRRTGSTYGIAAFYPRAMAKVEGRAQRYERSSDSGFKVEFPWKNIPTAFRASWGSGRPAIGMLGEYDALPNCGAAEGSWGHG